jgi:hypothetical protein
MPSTPCLRPTPAARRPAPVSRSAAVLAMILLGSLALPVSPASALKVATWNITDYNDAGVITPRQPHLRTVLAALDPDVIVLQELYTQAGRDSFLNNVLNVVAPGQWASSTYYSTCQSALFYKPAKVTLTFAGAPIATGGPRDVLGVRFRLVGYTSKLAETRLYSVHFKAGDGSTPGDSVTRGNECTALRTNMNTATSAVTPNYLLCGDTNFYGASERGYIRLTEHQADDDGRCFDPLTMPGTWNQYQYRYNHTQSTCSSGCPAIPDWSAGGLDDRFDLFITSTTLQDAQGMDLVPGTYTPYGNDGQHYNAAVNGLGFNNAVGMTIANALFNCSDHLPVMITLKVPAKIAAESQLDFGRVIVGTAAPERTLSVSDPAEMPADGLDYTLAVPAGFSAPAGPFLVYPNTAANTHTVSMTTTAAAQRSDTLKVSSDAADSLVKTVLLSGAALNHAVASLDSAMVVTSAVVDLGVHLAGEFEDQPVRVFDQGWSALQARLAVTAANITGGAGLFSIVGGFTPAEAGETGRTWSVRFDAASATPDSDYTATLTFSTADEGIPGGEPRGDLVVTLGARRFSGAAGTPERLPERTAFLPPSPNPFRGSTTLRFELREEADVAIDLFDLSGRRVTSILHGRESAGRHTRQWSPSRGGRPLQAGLYFVSFRAGGFSQARRVAIIP